MKQTAALKHARHDAQDDLKAELGRQLNLRRVSFFKNSWTNHTRVSRSASACQNQTLLSIWQKKKQTRCTSRAAASCLSSHGLNETVYKYTRASCLQNPQSLTFSGFE
jgi:hypothetical protein